MWDHRQFYVLREVYWRTGHAIYDLSWTGFENSYRPTADLSIIRQKHKDASRAFELKLDHAKFLSANCPEGPTDTEYQKYRAEIEVAKTASATARLQRDQLSEALRQLKYDQEPFDRRINVETRLALAFRRRELDLLFGTGLLVEWDKWSEHSDFEVSFTESLIYSPARMSSQRRKMGFVNRISFDNWLENTFSREVRLAKREGTKQFMEMQRWFLDLVARNPIKPDRKKSKELFLKAFTPKGKTTFDELWKAFGPDQWHTGGRPKALNGFSD